MTASKLTAESIIAIDLGTNTTRAFLFDVVAGQYRFIGSGCSTTTSGAPFFNAAEGVDRAVADLQTVTGRKLIAEDAQLIIPSRSDGSGFDKLLVIHSCGPEIKIAIAGLIPEISLQSAKRLAATINSKTVEAIGITDHRLPEEQVDAILRASPDLILLTGGTNNGAGTSVFKLLEVLLLACKAFPKSRTPDVIFAGNQALANKVQEYLEKSTRVHMAPNLHPSIEIENLDRSMEIFAGVVNQVRKRQVGGFETIVKLCAIDPEPAPHAFGALIKYLNRASEPMKSAFGVDIGSSSTTMAAAIAGKLSLQVIPFGLGSSIRSLARDEFLKGIEKWLVMDISFSDLRDYIWQKSLYSSSLPLTPESLAIEQAVARQVMRMGMAKIISDVIPFPRSFEPIIASGGVLTQSRNPFSSLSMLLDGIQPIGVTTVFLDQYGLAASLGAAARINRILPVQVLDSGIMVNLGTVIAPFHTVRTGNKILRVFIEYESGGKLHLEITSGMLKAIPLPSGKNAILHLEFFNGAGLDLARGHKTTALQMVGGECGIIIDGRGRPVVLPPDKEKRKEQLADLIENFNLPISGT